MAQVRYRGVELMAAAAGYICQEKFVVAEIEATWVSIRSSIQGEGDVPDPALSVQERSGGRASRVVSCTRRQALCNLYELLDDQSSFFARAKLAEDEARLQKSEGPSSEDLRLIKKSVVVLRDILDVVRTVAEFSVIHFASKQHISQLAHYDKRFHLLDVANRVCLTHIVAHYVFCSGATIDENHMESPEAMVEGLLLCVERNEALRDEQENEANEQDANPSVDASAPDHQSSLKRKGADTDESSDESDTELEATEEAKAEQLRHCAATAQKALERANNVFDLVQRFTANVYKYKVFRFGSRSLTLKRVEQMMLISDSAEKLALDLADALAFDEEIEQRLMAPECVTAIAAAVIDMGKIRFGSAAWTPAVEDIEDAIRMKMRESPA